MQAAAMPGVVTVTATTTTTTAVVAGWSYEAIGE